MTTALANDWIKVCELSDIPCLGSRIIARKTGGDIALFRASGDHVFALLDRCPHKGGPLSQGIIFGNSVACPLHDWNIDLQTGCAVAPDEGCARKFSVKMEGKTIFLNRKELFR